MMRAGVAGEGIILRMRNKQDFLIDKKCERKRVRLELLSCVRFHLAVSRRVVKGSWKSWLLCFGVGEVQGKQEGKNELEQPL